MKVMGYMEAVKELATEREKKSARDDTGKMCLAQTTELGFAVSQHAIAQETVAKLANNFAQRCLWILAPTQ